MPLRESKLTCFGRPVLGPLGLLRKNENGLTYALGYALSECPELIRELLRELSIEKRIESRGVELSLQEISREGISDLELHAGSLHILIEAKIAGWPHQDQLERYAKKLAKFPGKRILCPLGVPPLGASPVRNWRPGRGIALRHLRWIDVLRAVIAARDKNGNALLDELAGLIEEIIGMQAYDREVLVRDVGWGSDSFNSFFKHRVYICQASEIAEPLFFAPCISGDAEKIHKGIHYFSRVYCKVTFLPADRDAARESLAEAKGVIDSKVEGLKHRKTTAEEVKYLRSLPAKWAAGLKAKARQKVSKTKEHAVFFLGDPIPLPKPVAKRGLMVPLGFSVSLERLMNGNEAFFKC